MKLKLCKGVSESGIERQTWGNLSDNEIEGATRELERLREMK